MQLEKYGYMRCCVRKHGKKCQKSYYVHRFGWECCNGLIQDDKVVDHINDKTHNRLCNLELLTQQENCKTSAKSRDYPFVRDNHKNRKCVKATNHTTNEVLFLQEYVCNTTTPSNKERILSPADVIAPDKIR